MVSWTLNLKWMKRMKMIQKCKGVHKCTPFGAAHLHCKNYAKSLRIVFTFQMKNPQTSTLVYTSTPEN